MKRSVLICLVFFCFSHLFSQKFVGTWSYQQLPPVDTYLDEFIESKDYKFFIHLSDAVRKGKWQSEMVVEHYFEDNRFVDSRTIKVPGFSKSLGGHHLLYNGEFIYVILHSDNSKGGPAHYAGFKLNPLAESEADLHELFVVEGPKNNTGPVQVYQKEEKNGFIFYYHQVKNGNLVFHTITLDNELGVTSTEKIIQAVPETVIKVNGSHISPEQQVFCSLTLENGDAMTDKYFVHGMDGKVISQEILQGVSMGLSGIFFANDDGGNVYSFVFPTSGGGKRLKFTNRIQVYKHNSAGELVLEKTTAFPTDFVTSVGHRGYKKQGGFPVNIYASNGTVFNQQNQGLLSICYPDEWNSSEQQEDLMDYHKFMFFIFDKNTLEVTCRSFRLHQRTNLEQANYSNIYPVAGENEFYFFYSDAAQNISNRKSPGKFTPVFPPVKSLGFYKGTLTPDGKITEARVPLPMQMNARPLPNMFKILESGNVQMVAKDPNSRYYQIATYQLSE